MKKIPRSANAALEMTTHIRVMWGAEKAANSAAGQ
jgi:hypothetical protein